MRVTPHLCFRGNCKDAFVRYQQIFGGKLFLLTYGDSPMAREVHPRAHANIVHATLTSHQLELAGADILGKDYRKPQGLYVLVTLEDTVKAKQTFAALAKGGRVVLPFQPSFWSRGFGVLVDRFGVPWEIGSAASPREVDSEKDETAEPGRSKQRSPLAGRKRVARVGRRKTRG